MMELINGRKGFYILSPSKMPVFFTLFYFILFYYYIFIVHYFHSFVLAHNIYTWLEIWPLFHERDFVLSTNSMKLWLFPIHITKVHFYLRNEHILIIKCYTNYWKLKYNYYFEVILSPLLLPFFYYFCLLFYIRASTLRILATVRCY